MILINMLPPEYRKRETVVSAPMLILSAGGVLTVFLLLCWVYITQFRIATAEELKAERAQTLDSRTRAAEKVLAKEQEIVSFEKRRDYLQNLIDKKVYWARTLDDFVRELTGPELYNNDFSISVTKLSIAPRKASGPKTRKSKKTKQKGLEKQEFAFKWGVKVHHKVGTNTGAFIYKLFTTFAESDFWIRHGFQDSQQGYTGDRPESGAADDRVITEFELDWIRVVLPTSALLNQIARGGS